MAHEALERIAHDTLALFRPPPKIRTADWIERSIRLSARSGATPGAMHLWSYQTGIADAFDDPSVSRITLLKPARVGYSELIRGLILSAMVNDPTNVLALLPTEDDARAFMVKLEDTVASSPALRGLLTSSGADRSTMLTRYFPGGSLLLTAASTPGNLRGHTVKFVFADEVDSYKTTAEGDVISLVDMRLESYTDSKLVIGSTPTDENGAVSIAYSQSDQRIFEVPCPSCGAFAEILFKDIRWDRGPEGEHLPDTAHWVCPSNGCVVEHDNKAAMVRAGRWRATRPEVTGHQGFRLNAFYSPHPKQSWAYLVRKHLAADKRPEDRQVFVNTSLGEVWTHDDDGLDDDALFSRREPFSLETIPPEVLLLTAGVDVQRDRLECTTLGFGREMDVYVLDHRVFYGQAETETPWRELDSFLLRRWAHPHGGTMPFEAVAVDSGNGEHTELVHNFTRPRRGRRVLSIKGKPGKGVASIQPSSTQSHLFLVGTDGMKSKIHHRLEAGAGIRFSDSLTPSYFEQLTSEQRVVRRSRGREVVQWEKIRGSIRNETLDCLAYAWAIRDLVRLDLDERAAELASPVALKPALPTVIRSSWINAGRRPKW